MNGISVVICTYNGSSRLEKTLKSCLAQKASCNWEIIVVDNASSDGSAAFCEDLLSAQAVVLPWKVVHEPIPGLNAARLKGISNARFDIILFCDDDNYLSDTYVQMGYYVMNSNPAIGVLGGCGIPVFESEKPLWFDTYAESFAVGPQAAKSGRIDDAAAEVYGAGCFYRKQPLLRFFRNGHQSVMSDRKGNTLASGGDVEWCYMMQLAGYQVWYDERLQFGHLMTEGRLKWEYYLRLKAGIASGSARLFPYSTLLRNPGIGEAGYLRKWLSRAVRANLIYYKLLVKGKGRLNADAVDQLLTTIHREKAHAYLRDGVLAYRHFKKLKTLQKKMQLSISH